MKVAENALELVGNTPMLKLGRFACNGAEIYAKLEWYNPSGSVKDRAVKYLLEHAESRGELSRDKTILEATSGNTGIALAMFAAIKGYRAKIIMPACASEERKKMIKALGAELVLSPPEKGTSGAIELKKKLLRENPEKYLDVNQFADPLNTLAHYQTTGREIIEQMEGEIDMFIAGIGTAGTGMGVALALKDYNPDIKAVAVYPKIGVCIPGLRNPAEENSTKLFRREVFDELVEIEGSELEEIRKVAKEVARKEGLLVGISSATVLYVAKKKAGELGKGKKIVTILPDSGTRYLSTGFFD